MAKGERLRVAGFCVRRGSIADRCTHYADPYKFRLGRDVLIPTGFAALVNHHAARSNVTKIIVGQKIFLVAQQAIGAGEELFHKYSRRALKQFRHPPRGLRRA